jgi:LmbE family N-acetylglucosaminyl deacetylase
LTYETGVSALLSAFRRVIVICPHTDDEFGCAGTILRLVGLNVPIKMIALSRCEQSVPDGYPRDILEKEFRECASRMGINRESLEIWNFEVRHFPERRQDILERFVMLNKNYRPDLVIAPSSQDTHQDHATVFQESFRAFKFSSIIGYEMPQNLVSFHNQGFVVLDAETIDRKIFSLSAYESQSMRSYSSPEFIRSLAKVRGVQCNADYAEAFEVIRVIL